MWMASLSVLLAYVIVVPANKMFVGCRNSSREISKLAPFGRREK
jgi:hypothetical protein